MSDADTAGRHEVATVLRANAELCAAPGYSPFYSRLLTRMADDVEAAGPTWTILAGTVGGRVLDVPHLRVFGFVHRMVLGGDAPELAAHYPSVGGDGDADAVWPALRAVLDEHADDIRPWLAQAPQTNEVGRCAALAAGFAHAAAQTGLPLHLLEIGASAGLNLRFDRYFYDAGGVSFGDRDSTVRFVDLWSGRPPFDARLTIAEREACDLSPIDPTSEAGRLLLLGYVWPDQHERLELLRNALDIAARVPAVVEQADAFEWLPPRLERATPGVARLVYHSLVLQYFPQPLIERFAAMLDAVGSRSTPETPLAWLRLEPGPGLDRAELRLTTWPGGEEQLLATATFHHGPIDWLA